MFTKFYFALRYFAKRYFPKHGAEQGFICDLGATVTVSNAGASFVTASLNANAVENITLNAQAGCH